MARAETTASAASLAAVSDFADVARMLWHCIMRGLVGAAQALAPDGSFGGFGDGVAGVAVVAVVAGNCPFVDADGGVAAAAGLAFASPGNVKAATARHAPTAAYSLERKVNSPEYVTRDPVKPK